MSNNVLHEVLAEKTAAALWLKPESICMSKDLTSKMHMKMKLFTHKLQEGSSVLDHLAALVADLKSMEVEYDDEDLGLIQLCSRPTSFANFRDMILYSRDELTLHEVCEAFAQKEKMKQMVRSEESSSKGEALVVRGRDEHRSSKSGNRWKSKGRSKSKGNDKFCKYCKKTNHFIEDFCKLKNKEKRNSKSSNRNRSEDDGKASIASENFDQGDVLIAFAGCISIKDEWILDSACSYHVCTNKDYFSAYESVQNGGVVRMGDNTAYEVIGYGSVQFRMHDGMIRTLTM
jgi:hypothetical protein